MQKFSVICEWGAAFYHLILGKKSRQIYLCLSNYGGKSHAVNPFFADVSRASRFCASVQTPRKSGLARRCPRPSSRMLRRLATPRSPDNSAPRQTGIVRYNKFTIDPSAIQGFCVNPLYLFRERVEKIRLFFAASKTFLRKSGQNALFGL